MLVVDLRNTRINTYNYSVVGNKNADTIYFYYPKKYEGYTLYVKVLGQNIADKFRIYTPNIEVKDDCIRAKWIMPQSVTVNKEIQVQLEYDITLLGGGEIAQSKIVTLKLQNTLDIEGSVEPVYPTILQELREDLDAEILHRQQGDNALHAEIVAEQERAEGVEAGLQTAINGKVDKVEGKGLSTNDYTNEEKNKLAGVEAGAQVNVLEGVKVNNQPLTPTNKVVNIDLTPYALIADMQTYGKSLAVSIDPQTYVLTMSLKDANGNTLNTQTVDLPLETMVVSGSYDDTTKSLILVLKNGQTITIPVADLVAGLVSEQQLATVLQSYYTKTQTDNLLSAKADKTQTEADKLKALYHLGAFDTVDTSDPMYDVITRQTGYLDLEKINWVYNATYHYWDGTMPTNNAVKPSTLYDVAEMVCNTYRVMAWNVGIGTGNCIALANVVAEGLLAVDNASSTAKPTGLLQYKTATSYTEKVLKGQNLNTLDQTGNQFVRSEWEKTQNLIKENISADTYTLTLGEVNLKAGTYYLSISSPISGSFIQIGETTVAYSDYTFRQNGVFTLTNDISGTLKLRGTYNPVPTITWAMLNEGDHAYPYQPYNGAIVHEKDIENVARKDVDNNFTTGQTIYSGNNNQTLILNANNSTASGVAFYCQGQPVGYIGINNKRPYYWGTAGGKLDGELATLNDLTEINDLLAELKTIVYDNQYPAVAEIDLQYATYYALPSQISGDKIIMSAGMDMTKVKGRSYVVNQLINASSHTDANVDLVVEANGVMTGTFITASDRWLYLSNTANLMVGHKFFVFFDMIENNMTPSYNYLLIGGGSGTTVNVNQNRTSIVTLPNKSGNDIGLIAGEGVQPNDSIKFRCYVVDLTQWFGSNDAIPADLLADPSLFTKKYWKKDLPFDTGHIEDSKPVKVISYGVNLIDYENRQKEHGITSQGVVVPYDNFYAVTNIPCEPNTVYSHNLDGSAQPFVFFYNNNNYIGYADLRGTGWRYNITTPANCNRMSFQISNTVVKPMVNKGSTALPFQPFSRKEYPIWEDKPNLCDQSVSENDYGSKGWYFSPYESGYYTFSLPSAISRINLDRVDNYEALDTVSNSNKLTHYLEKGKTYGYFLSSDGGATYQEILKHIGEMMFVEGQEALPYKPFKTLRSAGSVQDDNEKVRVGVVDLGSLEWRNNGSQFYADMPSDCASVRGTGEGNPNGLCAKYPNAWDDVVNLHDNNIDKVFIYNSLYFTEEKKIYVRDTLYTSATDFKNAVAGIPLNYELATPTDQSPSFTLPENIEIQKGGTIEIEYDDGYSTPCDIDFEVAVSKVLEE